MTSTFLFSGDAWVPSRLVFETGESFSGFSPKGSEGVYLGELVFNTGMVGYVETMTDPSYCGQILNFTYPLIGNYGVHERLTWESTRPHLQGVVMANLENFYAKNLSNSSDLSNLSSESFLAWCQRFNIPLMTGVDTREVTKALRSKGVISGAIVIGGETAVPKAFINMNDTDLVAKVSIKNPIDYFPEGLSEIDKNNLKTLVLVDCGMKENILRELRKFKLHIKRVPHDYDFLNKEKTKKIDALFISNGPGDPTICSQSILNIKAAMEKNIPTFGICLGSQLMALAVGAKTYKLKFGHRSQNQPCLELKTDRCFLTSQNHGYAIAEETLPSDWEVTYKNLNDATVQGVAHRVKPFASVQFHPEASPGPVDTFFLFDEWLLKIGVQRL